MDKNRRNFLIKSAKLGIAGTALPFATNLALMGEAAAFDATDYKALVCVFLYGGNDYANTVVPYDDVSYNKYSVIRGGGANQTAGGIALAKSALIPTLLNPTTPLANGIQYALNPSMSGIANLFNTGKAAVQLNVGPLIVPINRTQYNSNNRVTYPLPPKLFSHNDQQSIWQSSSPEGSTIGWGGNLGDISITNNANANSTFSCISVTGNAVFLSGDQAISYNVSTSGAVPINGVKSNVNGSSLVRNALSTIVQQPKTHVLENEYNIITKRAITSESQISTALSSVVINTVFDGTNNLAQQLKMVAKMIAARNTLGCKRQVFMVSIGGFDLHDNLISSHGPLLAKVSDAITSFYNSTVELGVENKVTTFTASDFGRTLSSNGDGSDHGWGSHHLVVGGAVKGKEFYGKPPSVDVGNLEQDHVGQGRLIPSTSVDQYAATLAKWFGVSDQEIVQILPNINNFGLNAGHPDYPINLGFML